MAYDALAVVSTAQIKLENQLEVLAGDYGTYMAYLQNGQNLFPNFKESRLNESRPADLIYNKVASRSLGSGRSNVVSGAFGDSAKLTPSWVVKNDAISTSIKRGTNSLISTDERILVDIKQMTLNFAKGGEGLAVDHMYNNRSLISAVPTSTEVFFNTTTKYAHEITESTVGDKRPMLVTEMVLAYNDYGNNDCDYFCDPIAFNKFRFMAAQGISNQTNTSFQFDGKTFIRSMGLDAKATALSYTKGIWVTIPKANYGCISHIPVQNRNNTPTGTHEQWGNYLSPVDKQLYAVWAYNTSVNGTSIGGQTQDIQMQIQFSIDWCFEVMPLSTATKSPILLYALV